MSRTPNRPAKRPPSLSAGLRHTVLQHLGAPAGPPGIRPLDDLITAYTRTVPWESASRIARRVETAHAADCPRWPEEFWTAAIDAGTGGTCFESNYAFQALLSDLGYDTALTVNDMGETRGCHTAIIVRLDGRRRIADMGFPVYASLPIHRERATTTETPFHRYTVRPRGDDRYDVDRSNHPEPNCFTLVDRAVADEAYRVATVADYEDGGYFLDRLVIHKVIDGVQWRFRSTERPWRMESFEDGATITHELESAPAEAISARFGIDEPIVRTALDAVA